MSLRVSLRNPAFNFIAFSIFALAMAANTAVFSLLYAVVLRPLPYKHPDQLVVLWASVPAKGIPADWTSWPTIQDWRKQSSTFEDVASELRITSATLTGQGEPEQLKVGRVSANLFPLLGVQPVLGRTYTSDEELRREALVVISWNFWRRKFASSPSVIGKHIEVDHKRATVVGVTPPSFAFPSAGTQMWLPLSFVPNWPAFLKARQSDGFRAIARLKTGRTFQAAQSDLNVVAGTLAKQYPDTDGRKGIAMVSLAAQLTNPQVRASLWMLFAAVVVVYLMGAGNVASLLLASGTARAREFAIRAALGASRSRLIRQLMFESLGLVAVSSALGLAIATILLRLLPHLVPPDFVSYAQFELSLPVLLFALALSTFTFVILGFVPASQLSSGDRQNALKADSRILAGQRSHSRIRSALVIGEFALAVILLSGTGLLIRSFLLLQKENLGFTPAKLLVATVQLRVDESSQPKPAGAFFEDVLNRLKSMPGVLDVASTGGLFSDYTPNTNVITEQTEHVAFHPQTAPATANIVSEKFFQTMGIPLLRGRTFSDGDGPSSPQVAVINKSMAHQFWPLQNPIGQRFKYGSPGEIAQGSLTVIGVVGDMNPYGPGSKAIAALYRPLRQQPWLSSMDIVARYNTEPSAALENGLRQSIRSANRQIPHFAVQPVARILAEMSAPRRFETWLLAVFSGVSLLLAAAGIYGLLSHLVSRRIQEIGLRMALGATTHDVLRLILASGVKLAGTGIALGLVASMFVMQLVRHLLFGVSTSDPITMLLVPLTLLLSALAASYFPARRAAHIEPLASIKHE